MGLSLPINKSQHQYFRIIRMSTPTAMKSYNYSFLLLLFLPLINSIRSNHFYAASPHRQINPFPSHALSSSSSHSSLYTTPDHSTLQRPKHQQQQKSSSSFYESEMRDGSESSPSSLYHFHDRHRLDPVIDNSTSRNVTTASGKTVYLPCRIRHLGDRTVSWIRKSDFHVLTVGKFTYTSDERFKAVHLENSDDWSLQIRFPQKKDADQYVCQISGQNTKQNLVVNLNVVNSSARIVGGPVVYINGGSQLTLTCLINQTPGPADYIWHIFWHHNGEVINHDPTRIRVQTEKAAQITSKLIIEKAHPNDSGNYSCVVTPYDFAEPAHIAVHVLNNGSGHPEAIQHGKRSTGDFSANSSHKSNSSSVFISTLILLYVVTLIMSTAISDEEDDVRRVGTHKNNNIE